MATLTTEYTERNPSDLRPTNDMNNDRGDVVDTIIDNIRQETVQDNDRGDVLAMAKQTQRDKNGQVLRPEGDGAIVEQIQTETRQGADIVDAIVRVLPVTGGDAGKGFAQGYNLASPKGGRQQAAANQVAKNAQYGKEIINLGNDILNNGISKETVGRLNTMAESNELVLPYVKSLYKNIGVDISEEELEASTFEFVFNDKGARPTFNVRRTGSEGVKTETLQESLSGTPTLEGAEVVYAPEGKVAPSSIALTGDEGLDLEFTDSDLGTAMGPMFVEYLMDSEYRRTGDAQSLRNLNALGVSATLTEVLDGSSNRNPVMGGVPADVTANGITVPTEASVLQQQQLEKASTELVRGVQLGKISTEEAERQFSDTKTSIASQYKDDIAKVTGSSVATVMESPQMQAFMQNPADVATYQEALEYVNNHPNITSEDRVRYTASLSQGYERAKGTEVNDAQQRVTETAEANERAQVDIQSFNTRIGMAGGYASVSAAMSANDSLLSTGAISPEQHEANAQSIANTPPTDFGSQRTRSGASGSGTNDDVWTQDIPVGTVSHLAGNDKERSDLNNLYEEASVTPTAQGASLLTKRQLTPVNVANAEYVASNLNLDTYAGVDNIDVGKAVVRGLEDIDLGTPEEAAAKINYIDSEMAKGSSTLFVGGSDVGAAMERYEKKPTKANLNKVRAEVKKIAGSREFQNITAPQVAPVPRQQPYIPQGLNQATYEAYATAIREGRITREQIAEFDANLGAGEFNKTFNQ